MPRLALLLALVGFAFPAAAQSDYGSVYSRFALGQRFESGTSQSDAMGGAGLAIRSGFYTGADNPALSADLSLATFSASGLVRGVEATDATDSTSVSTAGGLGSLQLALPLYTGKLGLALSYQPYTRVDYRAAREGTVELDGGTEQAYRSNLEGNGGLQQISLGLGGKISESLTVGASADALVGTVEYLKRTEFPDALSSFTEVREAESTRLYGFTGTVGATFSLLDLAREGDGLTLAGAVTLPTTLHGSRAFTLGSSLDRDTLATQEDGTATLPLTARA
ncbi:MAG TPA: hypothetical protein EYQ24_01560, partial [Bacteroidetes bacterium]|nr:hypothetical protein [Bacteroidota bacterium]